MSDIQKKRFSKLSLVAGLLILAGSFLVSSCTAALKTLNPSISGPQLIVNPESISLGVAKLTGTDVVFEGSGFKPGDSVFITLFGPNKTEVVAAGGKVGSDGKFKTTIEALVKVAGILKANVSSEYAADGKQKQILVITQPPIPAGTYTVRATSMLSDLSAETTLVVREPSAGDRLKDWLGKKLGKIQDKRSK
jgi:hypothetical protein